MPQPTSDTNIRGVSVFFYSLIPWALSLGAMGWFAFGAGVHDANERAAAAKRIATAVGETEVPTSKYKLTFRQGAFHIDSARYDGHSLELYYHNNRSTRLYNYCFQIQQKAKDGTIIGGDSQCFPEGERALLPGERSELREDTDADDRTTEIVLSFDEPLTGY